MASTGTSQKHPNSRRQGLSQLQQQRIQGSQLNGNIKFTGPHAPAISDQGTLKLHPQPRDVAFIDLTDSRPPPQTSNPVSMATTLFPSRNDEFIIRGPDGDGNSGNASSSQGPLDPLPPAKAIVLNSRYKRRLGFSTHVQDSFPASAPPMSFVSPSTIQPASRGPATPSIPRGPPPVRQRQFKPQTARPVLAPQASKRDTRPKPYILEAPSTAPLYPSMGTDRPQSNVNHS